MKKIFAKVAFLSMIAILFLGLSTASAASKPKIDEITKKTDNSVTLKLNFSKYASKKVDIVVSIKNKSTDKTEEKTYENKKLDSAGKKTLKIEDLDSGTKYSFKVKIRKHSSGSWSDWSTSLSGKTKS